MAEILNSGNEACGAGGESSPGEQQGGFRIRRLESGRQLDAAIVRQAAEWLARMQGEPGEQDIQACKAWQAAHPDHALAWQRLAQLGQDLSFCTATLLPGDVAQETLQRASRQLGRRRLARQLLGGFLLLATGGVAYQLSSQQSTYRMLAAGLRTRTGERREVRLDDGTLLMLNTATSVDIAFNETQREIILRQGEILVESGPADAMRPLRVRTQAGLVVPVGTRFIVRDDALQPDGMVRVTVQDGAVDLLPRNAADAVLRLHAGQQASFDRYGVQAPSLASGNGASWSKGMLIAEGMPLAEFLAELSRYRKGVLRCDPGVAHLSVLGAFPLRDTDAVLAMLQRILPIRVQRLTPYWVTVTSA